MQGVNFRLSGLVQGVGFRWWTRSCARQLGIVGMVRNRPDGTVEVIAAGSDAAMASFRKALREGPPGARVDRVVETSEEVVDRSDFTIG